MTLKHDPRHRQVMRIEDRLMEAQAVMNRHRAETVSMVDRVIVMIPDPERGALRHGYRQGERENAGGVRFDNPEHVAKLDVDVLARHRSGKKRMWQMNMEARQRRMAILALRRETRPGGDGFAALVKKFAEVSAEQPVVPAPIRVDPIGRPRTCVVSAGSDIEVGGQPERKRRHLRFTTGPVAFQCDNLGRPSRALRRAENAQ
jgi:hypothetical protein